jgi:hypothetical protein
MNRSTIMTMIVFLCLIPSMVARAKTEAQSSSDYKAPTIDVTKLDITDKSLKLNYEVRNDSKQDIWICEDITVSQHDFDFEVYLTEDGHTLLIRRRFDVEAVGSFPYAPPHGRYVRLSPGQIRTESLLLLVPVYPRRVFHWGTKPNGTVNAKRLAIEIGYYNGDMPGMIFSMLEEAEKPSDRRQVYKFFPDDPIPYSPPTIEDMFGGLWYFNHKSEHFRDRDEEIVIPWTGWIRLGEKVSRIVIDGQQIPYEEKYDPPVVSPPDLTGCTRVEIRYQPSMLEYFFPYSNERALMSSKEVEYLQSLETIVVDDQEHLKSLAEEIGKGFSRNNNGGGIVTERSTAHVVCYRDDERIMSFTVFDDISVVNKEKQVFRYKKGLPILKTLTPQINPFELRVRCAANLRNLWYRFRLYEKALKPLKMSFFRKRKKPYQSPTIWCDFMVRAYRITLGNDRDKYMIMPLMCPSAGEGKCHYAINPNCKADSAADMVLLFETKAGWNQHGGPELFTFDNHEPKGGCVLLNDGTVKFIRTKEELQQLRWK